MSFFNKGFGALSRGRSLFNKAAMGGRTLFNKAPMALSALSRGLGTASRRIGDVSAQGDKLLSDPAVANLARQIGAGGLLGSARGVTGRGASASALLGRASQATNPQTYSGQSPAQIASSAIEKARSLGGQTKNLFA